MITLATHPTMTEHDWRFPRRPGHGGVDSLRFDLHSTYGAAYDNLLKATTTTIPGFEHNGVESTT
jgi:hypothetical protein